MMTTTTDSAVPTTAATGKGNHVAGTGLHHHDVSLSGYATTAQLTAETTARQLADSGEATARASADNAIQAAIDALTARVAALEAPVTPPPPQTVTVTTIADLYAALANNEADITLAPGSYSGGIYADSRFASRTKPGVIRCTGVTMNGGGLTHRGGAHDLEWLDLTFANWSLNQTGVLMFGGWDEPPAHHITVRRAKVLSSVRRTLEANTSEHGAYFSHSRGGIHDVLIEDFDVDATNAMGLATAIHMDHADGGLVNAYNVTARRTVFKGNGTQGSSVQAPLILWMPPVHDWLFDGATITNANGNAIRYESVGGTNIVFKDIKSTGSRSQPFYSSQGPNPPGVTFTNCSLA